FKPIQALAQEQADAMFLEISGHPGTCFWIEITVQEVSITMHHADFEFQLTQASRRFAGQQSTADDNNRLLQVCHLAQRERIANRSQINNISQAHSRDWRPDGTTAHRETCLVN